MLVFCVLQFCAPPSHCWLMGWSPTLTQHWVKTLWPLTPVRLGLPSPLTSLPGRVVWMVTGPGHLWCVQVWDLLTNTYSTNHSHYLTGGACPDLTDLHNGVISYSTVSTNGYRRVTTVATYSCVTGFTLTSGTSMRTCSGGVWDGTDLTCTSEDCWIDYYASVVHAQRGVR